MDKDGLKRKRSSTNLLKIRKLGANDSISALVNHSATNEAMKEAAVKARSETRAEPEDVADCDKDTVILDSASGRRTARALAHAHTHAPTQTHTHSLTHLFTPTHTHTHTHTHSIIIYNAKNSILI